MTIVDNAQFKVAFLRRPGHSKLNHKRKPTYYHTKKWASANFSTAAEPTFHLMIRQEVFLDLSHSTMAGLGPLKPD